MEPSFLDLMDGEDDYWLLKRDYPGAVASLVEALNMEVATIQMRNFAYTRSYSCLFCESLWLMGWVCADRPDDSLADLRKGFSFDNFEDGVEVEEKMS